MEVKPSYLCPKGYKQTEVGVIPEEWEVYHLGELISYMKGFPFKSNEYQSTGIRVVRVSDTTYDSIKIEDPIYVSESSASRYASWQLKEHDLVVSTVGSKPPMYDSMVGKVILIDQSHENTLLNQNAVLIHDRKRREYVQRLLLNHLRTKRYLLHIEAIYRGNANQASITLKELFQFTIPLPSDDSEQRAIATALNDVDGLLGGLNRLIAKKRDLKQAAMQQLLTGQTRLPGFHDEWEMKQLRNFGKCLRGVSYKGDSDLSTHDTPNTKRLLRSNNVQNAIVITDEIQFVNAARVSSHQILQQDDILICMANGSKALVGKAGIIMVSDGYEYTFGAFMGCFRTNSSEANPAFVFYLFLTSRYRDYINNLLAGSSINNLRPSSIESLEFPTPPLPEQTAIAEVLTEIDAELAALEQRREKTRALKQAMMQELLTGRIRLI